MPATEAAQKKNKKKSHVSLTNEQWQKINWKLLEAIQKNDINQIKQLIASGAKISHIIFVFKNPQTCKLLIEAGVNLNEQEPSNALTPLMVAALEMETISLYHPLPGSKVDTTCFEICEMLILAGADVNKQDIYGTTVLDILTRFAWPTDESYLPVKNKQKRIIQLLKEHGALHGSNIVKSSKSDTKSRWARMKRKIKKFFKQI